MKRKDQIDRLIFMQQLPWLWRVCRCL